MSSKFLPNERTHFLVDLAKYCEGYNLPREQTTEIVIEAARIIGKWPAENSKAYVVIDYVYGDKVDEAVLDS